MKSLREAPKVGLIMLTAVFLILAVMLVIALTRGDNTDQIGENQSPAPASPRPT
jgi:preprotein translocase subunit SecG